MRYDTPKCARPVQWLTSLQMRECQCITKIRPSRSRLLFELLFTKTQGQTYECLVYMVLDCLALQITTDMCRARSLMKPQQRFKTFCMFIVFSCYIHVGD